MVNKDKKTYIFDIDGVICSKEEDYSLATAYLSRINKINSLFDNGHTIIYWTARGSTTGIDWKEITKNQLKEWGAKYHDVLFGKPYYDYFVDDKGCNSIPFFTELYEFHLNREKYPFVHESVFIATGSDIYGREGIIKWM
jgi:hypothetical protein